MGIDIIVPGATGWGANAIAYAGEIMPAYSNTLRYLGFFGTKYLGEPVVDRSGTGTVPTMIGSGDIGDYYTPMSAALHWALPWPPNAFGSEVTIIALGDAVSGNGILFSNNPGAAQTNSLSLYVPSNSGGTRSNALNGMCYKGTSINANIALASGEEAIQAAPEYYAMTVKATELKSYRRRIGQATEATATASSALLPGGGTAYIGYSAATALAAGVIRVFCVGFYSRALTAAEVDAAFSSLDTFVVECGAV